MMHSHISGSSTAPHHTANSPGCGSDTSYTQKTARNATILHLESENARLRHEAACALGAAADHRMRYEQSLRTISDLVHVIEQVRTARRRDSGTEDGEWEDFTGLEIAARLAGMSAGALRGRTPPPKPNSDCVSSPPLGGPTLVSTESSSRAVTDATHVDDDDEFTRWLHEGEANTQSSIHVAPSMCTSTKRDYEHAEYKDAGTSGKTANPRLPRHRTKRAVAAIVTNSSSPVRATKKVRQLRPTGEMVKTGDYGEETVLNSGLEDKFMESDQGCESVGDDLFKGNDERHSHGTEKPFVAWPCQTYVGRLRNPVRGTEPSAQYSTSPPQSQLDSQSQVSSSSSSASAPNISSVIAASNGRYTRSRQTVRRFAVGTVPGVRFEFTRKARTVAEIYREWYTGTVTPCGTSTGSHALQSVGPGQGNPPIAELERRYGTAWRSDPANKAAMKYSSNYVSVRRMVVEFVDREVERRRAVRGPGDNSPLSIWAEEVCEALDGVVKGRIQGLTECLRAKRNPFDEFSTV